MSDFQTKPGVRLPQNEDQRPRRFYKAVEIGEADGGYRVLLDGRAVKSPARKTLVLPTRTLAEFVAEEWADQGERIDAPTMHASRLAFVTLDLSAGAERAILDEIVKYASTDLICYREAAHEGLVKAQAEAWDPAVEWAEVTLGARLSVASGVLPVEQSPQALAAVRAWAERYDAWRLAATAHATALAGSAILALMLAEAALSAEQVFAASRVDEDYQAGRWGEDGEAAERAEALKAELRATGRFIAALSA